MISPYPSNRFAANPILRIHIRTFLDKQFGEFLVIVSSRRMQRSRSKHPPLRIHVRTSSQMLFDGFNVSVFRSLNQRTI